MEVHWYYYAGFIAFVIAMLIVDLKFFHTEEHEPTLKESATWLAVWISLAVIFGVIVFIWQGTDIGIQYTAGYLIEYSLSVDNMFVFVVIFTYFAVPLKYLSSPVLRDPGCDHLSRHLHRHRRCAHH